MANGAMVIAALEAWILGYLSMPADVAYVCALWCAHTWVYEKFDATPYLSVTGDGPGVGKTKLLRVLALLSRGSVNTTAVTAAALLRVITQREGKLTLFVDEAETMAGERQTVLTQLANSGYNAGDVIMRAVQGSGQGVIEYRAFCPKAWAGIGDVRDTLRSRSIVVRMQAGTAAREFYTQEAKNEAAALVAKLEAALEKVNFRMVRATHLVEREREIWSPLVSVAAALGCDLERLTRVSADLSVEKRTQEKRAVTRMVDDRGERIDLEFAPRALADMRRCVGEGERVVFSAVMVERMKALPDGPWRKFRGEGLTELALAGLVARYGLKTTSRKVPGQKNVVRRGYLASAILGVEA